MAYKDLEKQKATHRKWYRANQAKVRAYQREWKKANREKVNADQREWIKVHPKYHRKWNKANRERRNEYLTEALCHYSQKGDPWIVKCVHCDRTDINVLTFDHINNDARNLRRKDDRSLGGWQLARWLRLHSWPEDIKLQVLCFNCNRKKEIERRRDKVAADNSKRSEKQRKHNEYCNERNRQIRLEALRHYGPNGEAKCSRCGEDDYDVLDLDHINGRRKRKTPLERLTGVNLALWLKRNNWPVSLQVMCHNCNWEKHFNYVHAYRTGL